MNACRSCQGSIDPATQRCRRCGRSVQAEPDGQPVWSAAPGRQCPTCGVVLPTGAKFCRNCGRTISPALPPTRGSLFRRGTLLAFLLLLTLGSAGVGVYLTVRAPSGGQPTPRALATSTATPPATPTPTPTPTPILSPTPTPIPVFNFQVTPTTFLQQCSHPPSGPPPPLPPITITLDNTGSNVAVSWSAKITERDPAGNVWATASPSDGSTPAGHKTPLTLTPIPTLCADLLQGLGQAVTFTATIAYLNTTVTINDTITPK